MNVLRVGDDILCRVRLRLQGQTVSQAGSLLVRIPPLHLDAPHERGAPRPNLGSRNCSANRARKLYFSTSICAKYRFETTSHYLAAAVSLVHEYQCPTTSLGPLNLFSEDMFACLV